MSKTDYKYFMIAPTSMGVRLTPPDRMQVHNSNMFYMQATSAESNVLNVASSLGENTMVVSKFVENSPIAEFIKRELRKRGIDYTDVNASQGGPWGYRHQFNIADSGFGLRGAAVWNDRAGEIGTTLSSSDFNFEEIFEGGVKILHLSGLVAALSKDTTKFCLEIARYAKTQGTLISFDLNYRATFWKGREEELTAAFTEIASISDILIGNEEDYQLCLGFKGPETGGNGLSAKLEQFKAMITEVKATYPQVKLFATTLREVVSANVNLWGAIIHYDGQWLVEEPRPIDIMDRIGGGDGFTGGLLYAYGKGYSPETCLQFGWACGALAAGSLNDYAEPFSEKQILDVYKGNARVKR